MKKYRFFLATINYTVSESPVTQFRVIRHGGSCYEPTDDVFATIEEALAAAIDKEGNHSVVSEQKVNTWRRTNVRLFESNAQAKDWIETQQSRVEDNDNLSDFDYLIDDQTLDAEDIEDFQHNPVYTVTLEIKTVKHLEVEIDTSEDQHDDIEDEYDAGERAKEMFESGDLDHQFKYYADEWDTDVDVYETSED